MGTHESRSVQYGEEKIASLLPGIEAGFFSHPVYSPTHYQGYWKNRPLQQAKVKVKVMLRLMVSQSLCLGVRSTRELVTIYYFLSESCCVVSVERPSDERSGLSPVRHCHQCLVHCQRFNIIYIVDVTCFKYMQYILDPSQQLLKVFIYE
jgi:hypothetical protein